MSADRSGASTAGGIRRPIAGSVISAIFACSVDTGRSSPGPSAPLARFVAPAWATRPAVLAPAEPGDPALPPGLPRRAPRGGGWRGHPTPPASAPPAAGRQALARAPEALVPACPAADLPQPAESLPWDPARP